MNRILFGVICGLIFGAVDVVLMLPLKYDNNKKRTESILGAFLERFMIGFIIPNTNLGISPVITGGIIGFGFSLPTSIITRAYIPINAIGILGGLIIGFVTTLVYH